MDRIDKMLKAKKKLEDEIQMKMILIAMYYKIEEMNISGSLEFAKLPSLSLDEDGNFYGFQVDIDILDYDIEIKKMI
ncbi:MAG: hypothetical protein RRZ66_00240 [Bacteroidales bacterium]